MTIRKRVLPPDPGAERAVRILDEIRKTVPLETRPVMLSEEYLRAVEQVEALKLELNYFVECIQKDTKPFNGGCAGLKVVRMLEAASESLAKRGELVYL